MLLAPVLHLWTWMHHHRLVLVHSLLKRDLLCLNSFKLYDHSVQGVDVGCTYSHISPVRLRHPLCCLKHI